MFEKCKNCKYLECDGREMVCGNDSSEFYSLEVVGSFSCDDFESEDDE